MTQVKDKETIGSIVRQRLDALSGKPSIKVVPLPNTNGKDLDYPTHWVACPEGVDPAEWTRAQANKDYYETKMLEDDCKKPWFQYPRFSHQYSEFVYITPEMAAELFKFMPINRKMKVSWVEAIRRDIVNDRWLQSHESLAINKLGNFQDGQHRAEGIRKAGKGWCLYVTWNVPPEAIFVTDSGERRKINEKLDLLYTEAKVTPKMAAVCRSMMSGLSARHVRYTESEIAEFAEKYHSVIAWSSAQLKGYRADILAVVAKAVLWYGADAVAPFTGRLAAVQFTGNSDPAKALYLWMTTAKKEGRRASYTNPLIFYKKTVSAVVSAMLNKDTAKLYQRQEDIYEWLPGWVVPPGAPAANKIIPVAKDEEDTEE